MDYKVTWNIDVEAESFEDAARIAREIQLDRDSLATHFTVTNECGTARDIWAEAQERR